MYFALSGGILLIFVMSQHYNCLMVLYTNFRKILLFIKIVRYTNFHKIVLFIKMYIFQLVAFILKWIVIECAPELFTNFAAKNGSGWSSPLAFLKVAILLILTLSLVISKIYLTNVKSWKNWHRNVNSHTNDFLWAAMEVQSESHSTRGHPFVSHMGGSVPIVPNDEVDVEG